MLETSLLKTLSSAQSLCTLPTQMMKSKTLIKRFIDAASVSSETYLFVSMNYPIYQFSREIVVLKHHGLYVFI